jgi:ADP-heptose:LPS heptosyltransferase
MTDAVAPRILLARPDHLGDVLLALPAAVWLRSALPNARIAALVSPPLAPITDRCPAIDETLIAPFPPPDAGDTPDEWRATLPEAANPLRDRFDIALLPRIDDPWSGALVAEAGIPIRIGFDHARTRRYLTSAIAPPRHAHVTRLALQVAGAALHQLGILPTPDAESDGSPWIIPTRADHQEVTERIAAAGVPAGQPPIVLHPGAGWPLKSWPVQRWGLLAQQIRREFGVRPIVTGTAAEHATIASIVAASGGEAVGLAGTLSLGGLAALYERAAAVIAIDSGPLHLAVAVGTSVVGIYGPAGSDEFGPWTTADRGIVVQGVLPCSPCRTLDRPPCGATSEPACLRAITVEVVVAALKTQLNGNDAVDDETAGRTR